MATGASLRFVNGDCHRRTPLVAIPSVPDSDVSSPVEFVGRAGDN